MRKPKISLEKVDELAEQLREELNVEIEKAIAERQELQFKATEESVDSMKISSLYNYQHALEHSRMNITTLVHRIRLATIYK